MPEFDPTREEPITDSKGECPVEIIAFEEAGLVIRSLTTGQEWEIAINRGQHHEYVEPTELQPQNPITPLKWLD